MKQEEKDLLFKDLSARLPYEVKVGTTDNDGSLKNAWEVLWYNTFTEDIKLINYIDIDVEKIVDISEIKPYLFPLSSMTEEQCEELRNLIHERFILDAAFNESICFKTYGDILVWLDEKPINECYFIFDYFNKHHLDYRGLIPMGLANDATNLNIY